MMIKRNIICLLFTFLPLYLAAQESDFGIWANVDMEYGLTKKIDLEFSGSVRTFNNTSKLEQAFLEGGVQYKLWKFLSVAGSYRYTTKLEDNGFFYGRHKLFADINASIPAGNFSLSGRTRLQRTVLTYIEDPEDENASYQLRIRLKAAYRASSSPLKPYISIEPFIPLEKGSVVSIGKYRYSAGCELYITSSASVDVGYLLERDFKPDLSNLHILNIGYKVRF